MMSRSGSRRGLNSALPGDPTTDFVPSLPWGYAPSRGLLAPTDWEGGVIRAVFESASRGEEPSAIADHLRQVLASVQADDERAADTPGEIGVEPDLRLADVDEEFVTKILDDPAYAGVWLTVGQLVPAVDPEVWIAAQEKRAAQVDPIQFQFVRKFGSTPPQSPASESQGDDLWDALAADA